MSSITRMQKNLSFYLNQRKEEMQTVQKLYEINSQACVAARPRNLQLDPHSLQHPAIPVGTQTHSVTPLRDNRHQSDGRCKPPAILEGRNELESLQHAPSSLLAFRPCGCWLNGNFHCLFSKWIKKV